MEEVPGVQGLPRSLPGAGALLVACCCTLLASCGGADGSAAPQPVSQVQPLPALQPGTPAALLALTGRTTVTLNAQPAPVDAAAPAAIVGVARDAQGNVQLTQADGVTRTLSPDGKLTVQPAAAVQVAGELPQSMIVAVDAANTVHVVDPDACVSRRIAADGRVTTTFLPTAAAGRACDAGTRAR